MGLLDRLHRIDTGEDGDIMAAPDASPETREKVDAILGVLLSYLDPEQSFASMLFAIARKELHQADNERLDMVIDGVIDAADQLRRFLPVVTPVPVDKEPAQAAVAEA